VIRTRLACAGLTVLASLTFVSACTDRPGGTASPGQAATEILARAAAKTQGQSFKFTLGYGALLTGDGAQSGDGKRSVVNMNVSDASSGVNIKINALVLDKDMYTKMEFGALGVGIPGLAGIGDKWMHINKTKVRSGSALGLDPNAIAPEHYIAGIVSAEKVSDSEIKGTIDLAKSAPPGISAADVAKIPVNARIVPFTATLDRDGRITRIVMTLPKVGQFPASDLTVTFADYGTPVDVKKPAKAQTVEAPDLIYQFL